ncbi:hypothetical protein Mapa_005571 [Marchantia paleacea]|nr:hypothetical protein Mapa_005571 [Marchantia paleacea]
MWGSWVDVASMQEADTIAIAMVVGALISLYNQVDALIDDAKLKDQVAWELQTDLRFLPSVIAEVLPALNTGNTHFDRNFFRVVQLMCKALEEARDALDDYLLASVSMLLARTLTRRLQGARNKIRHAVSLYNTYCNTQQLRTVSLSSQQPRHLNEPLQKLRETLQELETMSTKPCPKKILKLVAKMRSNKYHPVHKFTMDELEHFCRVGGVEALVQLLSSPAQPIQTLAMINLETLASSTPSRQKISYTPGALEQLATMVASTSGEVQFRAVAILRKLLQSDDHIDFTRVLFPGIIARLLQLLGNSSPRVQANAAGVLWELSLVHDNRMKIGAAPGALEQLVKLFVAPSPTLQFCAAATLCNVCSDKGLRLRAASGPAIPERLLFLLEGYENWQAPFIRRTSSSIGSSGRRTCAPSLNLKAEAEVAPTPGVIGWSVAMLDSALEHHQVRALDVLRMQKISDTFMDIAVQEGVLARIVKLLSSNSLTVQSTAANALWRFSTPDGNERKIAAHKNVIQRLVTMLDSQSSGVQENAVKVLESLSYCATIRKQIAAEDGAMERIARLLFLDSFSIQANSASALWNLSNTNNLNKQHVAGIGGILERLVDLLESDSSLVQEKAAGALMNLSYNGANRSKISAIPQAFARFVSLLRSSSTLVHQNAAGALFNLSSDRDSALTIAATPKAVGNLVFLLGSGSSIVQEYAAGAIANLSFAEETRAVFRRMNALPKMRLLKGSTSPNVKSQAKRALELYESKKKKRLVVQKKQRDRDRKAQTDR